MTKEIRIAKVQRAIIEDTAFRLEPGMRVLDLGCGNGETVKAWLDMGYDAVGCDFRFKSGPRVKELAADGRISLIETTPYRLPYEAATFDVVVSNQVFEHVADYSTTLQEMRRVLKPNGCTLHMFPSRGLVLEPHVFVPFATVIQNRAWLALWAMLGVRRESQKGAPWRKVADDNYRYLRTSTNYLRAQEIRYEFLSHFGEFRFVEREFLRHSPNARGRFLHRAGEVLPGLYSLYRHYWSRVILARP